MNFTEKLSALDLLPDTIKEASERAANLIEVQIKNRVFRMEKKIEQWKTKKSI